MWHLSDNVSGFNGNQHALQRKYTICLVLLFLCFTYLCFCIADLNFEMNTIQYIYKRLCEH